MEAEKVPDQMAEVRREPQVSSPLDIDLNATALVLVPQEVLGSVPSPDREAAVSPSARTRLTSTSDAEVIQQQRAELLSLRVMMDSATTRQADAEARFERLNRQMEGERDQLFRGAKVLREQVERLNGENIKLQAQTSVKGRWLARTPKVAPSAFGEPDAEMHSAQQQAELLRCIIQPMEAEINDLRRRLAEVAKTGGHVPVDSPDSPQGARISELETTVVQLQSANTDLLAQMQVQQTQKRVLVENIETVQRDLDRERTAHVELRLTWQRAQEHFLEMLNVRPCVRVCERESVCVCGCVKVYVKVCVVRV